MLGLVARGLSVKMIAFELGMAVSTVSEQVSSGLRKLGFLNRMEFLRSQRAAPSCSGVDEHGHRIGQRRSARHCARS